MMISFDANDMELALPIRIATLTMPAALALFVSACASGPAPQAGDAGAVSPEHEYRTGSLIVQKEKHVTTDEERQRAQDIAAQIRATGGGFGATGK